MEGRYISSQIKKTIVPVLQRLRATSSKKIKENILTEEKDNFLLKQVLYYTYNPYLKYKLTTKTLKVEDRQIAPPSDIFTLLDLLAESNISNRLRDIVATFLVQEEDEEVREVYKGILLKDLKLKCNATTFNKVWDSLIPSFSPMLAEKYWDYINKVDGSRIFTITMKMDGSRIIVIKENNNVQFFTRQGQEVEGLVELAPIIQAIPQDNIVIDGELLSDDYKTINPKDRFKTSSKLTRVKGEKKGLTLVAFDYLSLEEFRGEPIVSYEHRRRVLEGIISKHLKNCKHIEVVEKLYEGNDSTTILPLLDKVVSNGEEGLMINFNDAPYRTKRTTDILKVKKMLTADVRVTGVYEGEKGKEFEDTLGGVNIQFIHENQTHTCNCGSGFSVTERRAIWEDPNIIIGKIIEVHYFEVSRNDNGGLGLRFPIFKGIREDKFEISMH